MSERGSPESRVDVEAVSTSSSGGSGSRKKSSSGISGSSGSASTDSSSSGRGSVGRRSLGGPETVLATESGDSRSHVPQAMLVGVSTHEVGAEVIVEAREGAEAPPEFDARDQVCLTTKAEFDALRERYQIPNDVVLRMPLEGERSCWSRRTELCVNIEMFRAGFRVPVPRLVKEILDFYQVAPIQLMPNSWKQLMSFVIYFRRLGGVPTLNMFRHMFTFNDYNRSGWYYFAKRPRYGDLMADKPTSIKLWKNKFFYIRGPSVSLQNVWQKIDAELMNTDCALTRGEAELLKMARRREGERIRIAELRDPLVLHECKLRKS